MDGRTRRTSYLTILAIALVARLAAGVWWQSRLPADVKFAFGDSESYWHLARTIAERQPYRYGETGPAIFRTPGYPVLLAPLLAIFGPDPPVMAARALSAVLGTLSVAAAMGVAQTLFDSRIAAITGLALAVDPGTITLGVFVLSEAPFCPLMVLHVWAWVLAWRSNEPRKQLMHAAWGGVACGLATLMRPSWLLFLPFAGVIAITFFPSRRKQLLIGAMMFATLCLTMSPWWMRNYQITGRFIPTTLQVGASLYDGLSPQATGASDMRFVAIFEEEQRRADAQSATLATGTFEERLDQRLRDASLAWARQHPQRVIELVGIKLLRMWSPWPNAADLGSFASKLAITLGYVPLITLGLVGAWKYVKLDWSYALLVLPAVYFTLLHVIFVSSLRYRQPAMLLIAILAAAAIVDLVDRRWNSIPEGSA